MQAHEPMTGINIPLQSIYIYRHKYINNVRQICCILASASEDHLVLFFTIWTLQKESRDIRTAWEWAALVLCRTCCPVTSEITRRRPTSPAATGPSGSTWSGRTGSFSTEVNQLNFPLINLGIPDTWLWHLNVQGWQLCVQLDNRLSNFYFRFLKENSMLKIKEY